MKKSNFVIALISHRRHRFTKNSFSFEDFYEIFQLNIDFTSGDYILTPKLLKKLLFFQVSITAIKEQFRKSALLNSFHFNIDMQESAFIGATNGMVDWFRKFQEFVNLKYIRMTHSIIHSTCHPAWCWTDVFLVKEQPPVPYKHILIITDWYKMRSSQPKVGSRHSFFWFNAMQCLFASRCWCILLTFL